MFTEASIVLGVMVAVYAAARALRLSTELAMVASALGGAVAGGYWFPARQIAEGAATYLDINLIFITATLFMNLLKESGGVAFVVRPPVDDHAGHLPKSLLRELTTAF